MSLFLFAALCLLALPGPLQAQLSDDIEVGGYLEAMPLYISADLPAPFDTDSFWEYRLQNRLNVRWGITPDWTFNWQMRTRLFAGDLVTELNEMPGFRYADLVDVDDGIVDLSWVVADRETWLLHHIPDRLNIDWHSGDWRVTAGRQRVNWGINMISNPNDLFNIYSFYEFDYPERPGSDAVRIRHYIDWASRVEVAVRPARDMRNSVAAGLYGFNTGGYDVQLITGYYRNRWALGGGWAGYLADTGFKGELMLFTDLEEKGGGRETTVVLATGIDHMFDNSIFLIVEGLYNSAGGREEFLLLGEPLAADNPSFSRFQLTTQANYPVTPLLDGSLAAIFFPDEEALFISPSVTWSVSQNVDLNLLTQLFFGPEDSVFGNAGNVVAGSLTWNF